MNEGVSIGEDGACSGISHVLLLLVLLLLLLASDISVPLPSA
jgi:hypothetical protein